MSKARGEAVQNGPLRALPPVMSPLEHRGAWPARTPQLPGELFLNYIAQTGLTNFFVTKLLRRLPHVS